MEALRSVENRYDIPCFFDCSGKALAVILCHGFGSSSESPTNILFSETLRENGVSFCRFDWPTHGKSSAPPGSLRIANCLNDLASVEAELCRRLPEAEIAYFGSSFGAYLILLYLATRPHKGKKAFLRSAAVDMPGIFSRETPPPELEKDGAFWLDRNDQRPIFITQGFLDDLAAHDVFRLYPAGQAELMMIHGEADSTADPAASRRFAAEKGARLILLPGAEHRLMEAGNPERVCREALHFFTRSAGKQ